MTAKTVDITNIENRRVVSGMRTTGRLHLGNFHGALKNWVKLQHEYDCFFFAADWHGLTTQYENTGSMRDHTFGMIVDWLAAGLNPGACKIFIQSSVLEHAELHLLLSMITPLSWLERVPTYKDQQEKLKEKNLATYGFLGYPVLQSADILLYKPGYVPVGEDQIAHVELTREIARRFNHLYGRDEDFQEKAEAAISKMSKKQAKSFKSLMKNYQERGNMESLEQGQYLLSEIAHLSVSEKERLYGFLEGSGKTILPEPQSLLTNIPKMPGIDGQKMSKSYNNTIGIAEDPKSVEKKIKTMLTDPARKRRQDPGDPEKCPVWELHKIYSAEDTQRWVQNGCKTAGIGCLDCKGPIVDAILKEQTPIRERLKEYESNPKLVHNIVREGEEAARSVAKSTLVDVREAMGIEYS